jgi:fatty-acyl-CoA synthase
MPKGVMWRQDDLFNVLGGGGNAVLGIPPASDLDELVSRLGPEAPRFVLLSACPLMHGTGQFSSLIAMNLGGCIVTLPSRHFDVDELLAEVERNKVSSVIIVGQAFAGPILDALDADPGKYDLSSVIMMSSSGVMWAQDNKEGLLRHLPQAALFDSFGSSEAVGMGASVSTAGGSSQTARFQIGPSCGVFTEDGRRVVPGSGERGLVAVSGFIPLGYYKDEAKTAQTFRTFEGQRWTVPGDWAEVNEDGTLVLLGRGSVCINTGGEKVFPEEVEAEIRKHPSVFDCLVVGVPDDRFGERVVALVQVAGGQELDEAALTEFCRRHLARYKAPRRFLAVGSLDRSAAGKANYQAMRARAVELLTAETD